MPYLLGSQALSLSFLWVLGMLVGAEARAAAALSTVEQLHADYAAAKLAPGPIGRAPGGAFFNLANSPFTIQLDRCDAADRCKHLFLLANLGPGRKDQATRLEWWARGLGYDGIHFMLAGTGAPEATAPVRAFREWNVDAKVVPASKAALPDFVKQAQDAADLLADWNSSDATGCVLPGPGILGPSTAEAKTYLRIIAPSPDGRDDYLEIGIAPDGSSYRLVIIAYVMDSVFKRTVTAYFQLDGQEMGSLTTPFQLSDERGLGVIRPLGGLDLGSGTLEQLLAGRVLTLRVSEDQRGVAEREILRRDFPLEPLRKAFDRAKSKKWTCSAS